MECILNKLVTELKQKQIYIYEKQAGYLQELSNKYPVIFNHIKAIIEPNARYQGEVLGIPTAGIKVMEKIDWTSSALIITSDYYEEAFEKLLSLNVPLPETIYYFLNDESEIEFKYRKRFENCPLTNTIIFRSGPHASAYVHGSDFADNARAVFEYMLSAGYNKSYKLVWLVKNPYEFLNIYNKFENVEFISFDWNISEDESLREKYYETLFTAKYILFTDAYGFVRNCRSDQIRIQLWHGCGFKTRTNFVPCEKRYEYNIVISPLYQKIHREIYGLRDDQVVITGYPKADWLFHPVIKEKLLQTGIPNADHYIFWLPTFRKVKGQLTELNEASLGGDTGLPMMRSSKDLQALDEMLGLAGRALVIKLHPFQDEGAINVKGYKNIVTIKNEDLVQCDLQINQILGYADALISDYSSVAVEYMNLDRPMAFTLDDMEEYKNSRGFVFDNIEDYLPGEKIYSANDFMDFVTAVINNDDRNKELRHRLINEMHTYHDDQSCKRVVDWILKL